MLLTGIIVAVVVIFLLIMMTGYLRVPPNKVYVISGFKGKPKFVSGRSVIKVPFFERKDELDLSLIQVDIRTGSPVPTNDYIDILVDGVANIQIDADNDVALAKAAKNFLNEGGEYIAINAREVLEGNMREIIGQTTIAELVQDRDKFGKQIEEQTEKELQNMGLTVVNLNIQNFKDQNNVIQDLGIDNLARIQKDAAIARANSERDVSIQKSKAESEANEAKVQSETAIAERENTLALKKSKLQEDAQRAQALADAAYDITKEQTRKNLEEEKANANIMKEQKEVELAMEKLRVQEKMLEVNVKKPAEAKNYQEKQVSDAEKYRLNQLTEAKKKEAEATREMGLAEAEVILKKAQAENELQQAALAQRLIEVLPELVASAAQPLAQTEKIVMFGDGNAERMMQDTMNSSFSVFEGVKEATGLDLKDILNTSLGVSTGMKLNEHTSEPTTEIVDEK